MKKQTRRKFSPEFKAKVAIEAIKEQLTLAHLSEKFEVNPVTISKWKSEFLANASAAFWFVFSLSKACIVGLRVSVSEKPQVVQGTTANIQSQNLAFMLLLNIPGGVFFACNERAINI